MNQDIHPFFSGSAITETTFKALIKIAANFSNEQNPGQVGILAANGKVYPLSFAARVNGYPVYKDYQTLMAAGKNGYFYQRENGLFNLCHGTMC